MIASSAGCPQTSHCVRVCLGRVVPRVAPLAIGQRSPRASLLKHPSRGRAGLGGSTGGMKVTAHLCGLGCRDRDTHVLLTICRRSPFLKDKSVSVRDS